MNQHLQSILDFIERDKNLSADEKNALLRSLKDADKELEITTFKLDRTEKVKRTTAILLEETIEELEQKRKAVEVQNKELEIESSLERVRTVAMGMIKRDDMLDICRIISEQLDLLQVLNIRNVQTAIFDETKHIYLNYEYYGKHNKTFITEVDYTVHPVQSAFAQQMLKGKGSFFSTSLEGKKLDEFIEHQKAGPEFVDPFLFGSVSLTWYWASLGPIAFGISTYSPLDEESQGIVKRFRNVFDLSYRRYLDIEKAEAQAKEARIETALERVRAVVMAMKNPRDLTGICEVLYAELQSLGFTEIRNAMINIHDDEKESFVNYDYSEEIGESINQLTYDIHPLIEKQIKQVRSAEGFSEISFTGTDLKDWIAFRKKVGEKDDSRIEKADALYYYFYSIGTGSIGISTFSEITEEKLNVLKRFRNVFNLSYQRYTDIALAEAQAQEAKIEASLERMRAAAMSMQRSDEIIHVSESMYKELTALGFTNIRNAQIAIENETKQAYTVFEYSDYAAGKGEAAYNSSHIVQELYNELGKTKDAFYQKEFSGKEFEEWRKWRKTLPVSSDSRIDTAESVCFYLYSFGTGHLGISTFNPITEEQIQILKRFKKVFELSYQRYADVAKAEAQSKEAKIELALERVRARTMAMQKSDELGETAYVLFQQFEELGEDPEQIGIGIMNEEERVLELSSTINGKMRDQAVKVSIDEPIIVSRLYAAWKEEKKSAIVDISGKDLEVYNNYRNSLAADIKIDMSRTKNRRVVSAAYFSKGLISLATTEPRPAETIQLLERFASVFDLTYTRFLDLKKAEAQAREARIEAALEKVRSRSLVMHKSDELNEVVTILFEKLKELQIPVTAVGIAIYIEGSKDMNAYVCGENADGLVISNYRLPYFHHKISEDFNNTREKHLDFFIGNYSKEEKNSFYKYVFEHTAELRHLPDDIKTLIFESPVYTITMLAVKNALFNINDFEGKILSENEVDIIKRFARVFDQAYTRFLDLQKAEAQAREAKIEAALERTRTQSMIMQHSNELEDTLRVFHEQVLSLGIPSAFSFLWLPDEKNDRHIFWAAWKENLPAGQAGKSGSTVFKSKAINYPLDRNEPATAQCLIDWKGTEPIVSYHVPPPGVKSYFAAWQELIAGVEQLKPEYFSGGLYYVEAFMKYGCFGVMVAIDLSDGEKKILGRFAIEFERTYTRFLDLQKAEAQAGEAKIEAALERVRSRTLAMQRSDELAETAAILFRQLILLGIAPNRLYIGIVKDDIGHIECWVTDEDGSKVSTQFSGNTSRNASMHKMFEGWKEQKKSLTIDMHGKELENYFHYLSDELHVPFKGGLAQKRRVQTIAYFSKGFIGIASPDEQPEETTLLLERFAAVFNLTYTRFNDLKVAEAHAIQADEDLIKLQTEKKRAEDALTELRATQTQLIQSEKMASLGELTAGIAHEIQNPLNFVNNFSEVNTELIAEMKDEIEKGNLEEVKALANDIADNEQKINHHGKRADAIVKGMLQHSRSSSATKEPTDINKLADEYLRLAYHGLRAKDKSFNASMKTAYDDSIGNIKIIPQDIGRVILNLITNAFYAVTEKKKENIAGYDPTVSVSTKKINGMIEIKVKDNGNGIPQKVLDKIFQPFFTTKPTGEGTGLGLSMSYDIVTKAHSGELKVNTKEGEGAEFIIILPV